MYSHTNSVLDSYGNISTDQPTDMMMMIWLNSNADLSLLALGFFFFFFYILRWYIETAAAYVVVVVAVVVVGLVAKQREGFTF